MKWRFDPERVFPVSFGVCFALALVSLHLPFGDAQRFIMEHDQMVMLHGALNGEPGGLTIGATQLCTLPSLQWFYALFFRFSGDLEVLFWTLLAFQLVAMLALYGLTRRALPRFSAELLLLLLLLGSHRHYDYWTLFLPNTHSQPFVIGLVVLLVLFHRHGQFRYWHLANVLLCFVINLHALNIVLLALPIAFGVKNRHRFDRRKILESTIPYLAMAFLFVPQAEAFASVLNPAHDLEGTPTTIAALVNSALVFFGDHTFLGFLGALGLVPAARLAWGRRDGSWLQGLALVTLATGVATVAAYLLAGRLLHGETAYRCRGLVLGMVLAHFFALLVVIRWPGRQWHRRLVLLGAIVCAPLVAFDGWEQRAPHLRRAARTSERVYTVAAGVDLARALRRRHGVAADMLRGLVHVPPLHNELLFFMETDADAPDADARRPNPRAHLVVELLDRELHFRPHFVEPCFHYIDLSIFQSASVRCDTGGGRYLYAVVRAGERVELELDGVVVPFERAPEVNYQLWNFGELHRSVDPVALPFGGRLQLRAAPASRPSIFESPVLLSGHIPHDAH